ncbi:MAG: NAD-dependent dihydropyrimidine dehydrogenase subunit PreA [Clostridia bacterium]|nr:NAD-dependent dihydropyrimidine dehydrogenase subunit PreA [Clostridia bacterium]
MKLTHDLSVDFCGKHFINPFSIAASPPSDRRERIERAFEAGWAGAVFKTTSVEEEPVHLAYPIMSACAGRGLNAYGNIDLISERHISEICSDTRYLKERYPDRILIGSIMARNRGEWELLVHELEEAGIDMIECSMSCPQGDGSGVIPVTDPGMTKEVTGWIRDARRKDTPIIVKLTPMVANLTEIALAAKEGGADAVCAIDSVHGYCGIDLDTMLPKLSVGGKSTYCGISGPAVKPVALACVSELARTVGLPVAGVGGISTWEDAAEFLLLGAGTLQLCTAVMRNGFGIIAKLLHGLDGYMQEKGFERVSDMVGKCLDTFEDHEKLDRSAKRTAVRNPELCIGCGKCCTACQNNGYGAIRMEGKQPVINPDQCRGCGFCTLACPEEGCLTIQET